MQPLRIILVRHGESTANVDRDVRNTVAEVNIPLTELGKLQARASGERLDKLLEIETTTYGYVSPYLRAKETLSEMTKTCAQLEYSNFVEDVRIRELEYGSANSDTLEEKAIRKEEMKKIGGPWFYRYPGGESYSDLYNRISNLYNEILLHHSMGMMKNGTVVLVCHAHVMACFDVLIQSFPIKTVDHKMENGAIRVYLVSSS
jgi:broad specificity phosphatase PhoE